jgi:hypothetical protein
VDFDGDAEHWTLQLEPTNNDMRLYVKKIHIYGSGDKIRQIDTLESNGDHSVMTIHHPSE